jgi:hypothetical protein
MAARTKPANVSISAHAKTDQKIPCPLGDGGKLTVDADFGIWCPTGNHWVYCDMLFVSNKQVRPDA